MVDHRFDGYPVDARFPSPGVDNEHDSYPADGRFPSPGTDTRWDGGYAGASYTLTVSGLVDGYAVIGIKLTASTSDWTDENGNAGTPPGSVAYTWNNVVGTPVGAEYTPVAGDDLNNISVTAVPSEVYPERTSQSYGVRMPAPVNTVLPAVTPVDADAGDLLTTTDGTWQNADVNTTISYQWKEDSSNVGANQNTHLTDSPASKSYVCEVTQTNSGGSVTSVSNEVTTTGLAPPVAAGELPDVAYTQNSGDQTVDASVDFTPSDLTYTVATPISGVTIGPTTGIVTIPTENIATGTITVTGTNAVGFDQSAFEALISEKLFNVEITDEEPVITAVGGDITLTYLDGPYQGTYTTDWQGATLTVANVEAAPVCFVRPTVSAASNDITVLPGLWLYDGPDQGDQTWVQKIDGVPNGETDLTYVIQPGDDGKTFTIEEAYGGQTAVPSVGHVMVYVDTDAPVLTAPTAAADGPDGATSLGVTTDTGEGTLYWGIYPTASTPSSADVVAGTGATVNGSQAVSTAGVQSVADQTGLTADTAYKTHYVQDDASANRSGVATSAEFTTEASASPIEADTGRITWYQAAADQLTLSGADVIGWDNKMGSSDWNLDQKPTTGWPQWDAANSVVTFNGSDQAILSSTLVEHPLNTIVNVQGKTLVQMMVVETVTGRVRDSILSISQNNDLNNSTTIGYSSTANGGSDANIAYYRFGATGVVAYGNEYGSILGSETTPIGKILLEVHMTPTEHKVYVGGVLTLTDSMNLGGSPLGTIYRLTLGGRASDTALSRVLGGKIYEVFMTETSDATSLAAFRSELNARHGL